MHRKAFTHRSFYTQKRITQSKVLHRASFYTEKLSHRESDTQRSFYAEKLLRTEAFTQSKLLHREAFTDKQSQTLLHREAFTYIAWPVMAAEIAAPTSEALLKRNFERNFISAKME